MSRTTFIAAMLLVALPRPALAEEPVSSPDWTESSEWGWLLIGSSLALGAALTAVGLAEDCHGGHDCKVEQSQYIWGGIGFASTGSMVGFVILENSRNFDAARPEAGPVTALTLNGSF